MRVAVSTRRWRVIPALVLSALPLPCWSAAVVSSVLIAAVWCDRVLGGGFVLEGQVFLPR